MDENVIIFQWSGFWVQLHQIIVHSLLMFVHMSLCCVPCIQHDNFTSINISNSNSHWWLLWPSYTWKCLL